MAHYNLIFQGKIIDGYSLHEVRANIARLFNADAAKTELLFSGKTIVIKKNLDSQSTKKYLAVLKKAGAHIKAVKIVETESPPPVEVKAQAPSGELSAGLASLISYSKPKSATADIDQPEQGLQLAPPGAILQDDSQHHNDSAAQLPDTSHLTMSEAQSGSLAEFSAVVTAIELPDIDSLSLSEANTGSLEEFALRAEPVELPDISKLDIAAQDNTPLSAGSSAPRPAVIPNTADLSLSEAGEDTFAAPADKVPPVELPDISHIEMQAIDGESTGKEQPDSGKAVFQIN